MAIDVDVFANNGFDLAGQVRDAIAKATWLEDSDQAMCALAMKAAYAITLLEDMGEPQKAVYAVPHLNACLVQLGLSPVARKDLGARKDEPDNPLTAMQNDRTGDSPGG